MFMLNMLMNVISSLLIIICVLVGVAFLPLLERTVSGYIQIRKGANKVRFCGIPQPFWDAIKLFTKEQVYPIMSNYLSYYVSSIIALFLPLLIWMIYPYLSNLYFFYLGLLFFYVMLK